MLLLFFLKLAGTAGGVAALHFGKLPPIIALAIIGILPVWLEAVASAVIGVEAGREYRLGWKLADLIVDGISFIFAPAVTFTWLAQGRFPEVFFPFLAVFALCGGIRIARFFWKGLLNDRYFEGLPLTYTGYFWWVIFALAEKDHAEWALAILALESLAMISTFIRIPAGGGHAPMDRREGASR